MFRGLRRRPPYVDSIGPCRGRARWPVAPGGERTPSRDEQGLNVVIPRWSPRSAGAAAPGPDHPGDLRGAVRRLGRRPPSAGRGGSGQPRRAVSRPGAGCCGRVRAAVAGRRVPSGAAGDGRGPAVKVIELARQGRGLGSAPGELGGRHVVVPPDPGPRGYGVDPGWDRPVAAGRAAGRRVPAGRAGQRRVGTGGLGCSASPSAGSLPRGYLAVRAPGAALAYCAAGALRAAGAELADAAAGAGGPGRVRGVPGRDGGPAAWPGRGFESARGPAAHPSRDGPEHCPAAPARVDISPDLRLRRVPRTARLRRHLFVVAALGIIAVAFIPDARGDAPRAGRIARVRGGLGAGRGHGHLRRPGHRPEQHDPDGAAGGRRLPGRGPCPGRRGRAAEPVAAVPEASAGPGGGWRDRLRPAAVRQSGPRQASGP